MAAHAEIVLAPPLPEPVCDDPTDDMLLACAVALGSRVIVSEDRHLLQLSGYRGVEVVCPRLFVESMLG